MRVFDKYYFNLVPRVKFKVRNIQDYLNAFSEAEGEEQLKKLVDFCVKLQGEFADSLALEFGNTPSWVHNAG